MYLRFLICLVHGGLSLKVWEFGVFCARNYLRYQYGRPERETLVRKEINRGQP